MVKPIPIHNNTAHVLYDPHKSPALEDEQGKQSELAVSKAQQGEQVQLHNRQHQQTKEQQSQAKDTALANPIDKALDQLNEKMKPWAEGVQFEVDPDLDRLVISIVDNDSGEVLRTIPSEALLQVAKMIANFQGQGIDIKV